MKREVFERRFPIRPRATLGGFPAPFAKMKRACNAVDMGLAPGGRMKQEIYADPYELDDWDLSQSSRCFVHITNTLAWQAITGQGAPHRPPSAAEYSRHGFPWFDYYDESPAVQGSGILGKLKSVLSLG